MSEMKVASTEHVKDVAVGVVAGAAVAAGAVALAPIVLPAVGLAAVSTVVVGAGAAVPWLGATVGGWMGWSSAEGKAKKAKFYK
jgi:hypothetical protein